MQVPQIVDLQPVPLIGLRMETMLSENIAPTLWKNFRQQIKSHLSHPNPLFYSVQEFSAADFSAFNDSTRFLKWAAVRQEDLASMPAGMPSITLQGAHAVFLHTGVHTDFGKTTQLIFHTWLPASEFLLDHRPHFEIMDERYLGPMSPDSVEEIWIPIKRKVT